LHRKIVSKSFKFIKKYALKLLLENNNKIFLLSFQPSAAQDGKSRLGPVLRARAGRTQAATWAWASKMPRALASAWAGELAQ